MKKVIICDDHELVREGIKQLIQTFGNFTTTHDVSSGEALIKILKISTPDVVILDVSLPGRSGLEVLKAIKNIYPSMNVLILSMYAEEQFAIRMIKAGAAGYLHKGCHPNILKEALNKVSEGQEYLSPRITKLLFDSMNRKDQELPHNKLSDREFEVFLSLGDGHSLSEIAHRLNLSVKTISTYRTRVLDKMDVDNNTEIVKYIMHNKLSLSEN